MGGKETGANACVILEPEELTMKFSTIPQDNPPIEREARILYWIEGEDDVPVKLAKSFYTDKYYDLDDEVLSKVSLITKFGSVPAWVQQPDEAPKKTRFLGQLDSNYSFFTAPATFSEKLNAHTSKEPLKVENKKSIFSYLLSLFSSSKPKEDKPLTACTSNYRERIYKDELAFDGRTHYCKGPNFGDGGMGYIFIEEKPKGTPKAYFFWQCS